MDAVWKGAWNNGRANYRCDHTSTHPAGLPRTVFVREDRIVPHLAALLIRVRAETVPGAALEDIDVPSDIDEQVTMCREAGLTLRYHQLVQVLATDGRRGTITIGLP